MLRAISSGTVHALPTDLRKMLLTHPTILHLWEEVTPLARNEWICWVEDAKKEETRALRIEKARSKLSSGMRRPCCWAGCKHRNKKK
jgi:uncharacterized protein YdeI (YjbR/CyaY-like superfamily)